MGRVIILPDTEEFPFTPSGFDGVTIWYRRVSDEQIEEIDRKYRRIDTRHGRREVYIPEERLVERSREIVDATVVRWEGIRDKAGQPVPCTSASKAHLFTLFPDVLQEFLRVRTANIPQPEAETNGTDPTRR